MPDAASPLRSALSDPLSTHAAGWLGVTGWHAGWALAQLGLLAATLLATGGEGLGAAAGLALLAAPGVVGAVWRRGPGRVEGLAAAWTAATALGVAVAGGAGSPLAPELLAPALALLALGVGPLPAVAASAAAAALAAWLGGPTGGAGLAAWLGWACAATVAAAAATAWAAARRPAPPLAPPPFALAPPGAPPEVGPAGADPALAAAEHARAEAERERDDARESAAARTRFLAHMSHELRTPLNAVIGFSDIMRTRLFGPMPERYGEYAGLIHESGEHLLAVINDVLDLAKTEAGRYELRREVFDARDALNAALRLTRVQADEAGVDLRAAPVGGPVLVDADERALKQMALNLISNALKFTPRGGHVTAGVSAQGGELQLLVADTGVGIAPEDLERLGRPFEQTEAAQGRQGTGLGLSLVRAFARLHGGEMRLESRLGAGTAVTVRMPVLAPAAAQPIAPA